MTQRRIAELLAKEGPRIRKRFRQVMQRVRDSHTVAQLEQALAEGRIAEVLDDVERAAAAFATRVEALRTLAATEAAEFLSQNLDKLVSYDAGNPKAVELVRHNRARLVSGVTEQQRLVIVDVIAEGTAKGINPRQMARGIRDAIGLTRAQAKAVSTYRARLEEPTPLNPDEPPDPDAKPRPAKERTEAQVDRMVERFAERQLKARAEAIARTEALSAVHEGLAQSFGQAIENGTVEADQIVQRWNSGKPPRTRPHHAVMNGQERPWGVPFTSGLGNALRWPGDVQAPVEERARCRCAVSRRLVKKPAAAQAA